MNRDDAGASAVEYSLVLAAIAGVIVLVVAALGALTNENFTTVCDNVNAVSAGSCTP